MCGILGVHLPLETHRNRFATALQMLAHRGPDGDGIFDDDAILLGHRRLAIIGLGPAGDQPMIDGETGVAMVFNGEIYNYIEIRDELIREGVTFTTGTDTEVLLKAWLKWGPAALPRLNGMWAFGVWDPRSRDLVICRDRFGVKPMYYAVRGRSLMFASEPKALFRLDPALAEPDPTAIRDLFATSRSHAGTRTFFADIAALAPGHYARVNRHGKLAMERYWDYPEKADAGGNDADRFATLFDTAVAVRLRSDVPVGLTLSGGLDSSAILASAAQTVATPLRCFTSVYSDQLRGEEAWAQRAAALVNADLLSIHARIDDWQATLEKIVWHMDSPGYSPAVFPLWRIMQQARADGITVLLEGQGADELLAGYPQYVPYGLAAAVRDAAAGRDNGGRFLALARGSIRTFGVKWSILWLLRHAFPSGYRRWSAARGAGPVFRADWTAAIPTEPATEPTRREPLFARLAADHARDVLPALLHYGDAISMAHGIESRQPFLDYRLVEWVFRSQPALLEGGQTKRPVRDYLRRVGFGIIAARPDKQGYPTPLVDWLRGGGTDSFRALLADPANLIWNIFDKAVVAVRLDQAVAGNYGALNQLYKILTIDIWLKQLAAHRNWSASIASEPASERAA